MRQKVLVILLILTISCFWYACTKSSFVQTVADCSTAMPTYENNMREIVDTYCSYSGCHDGVTSSVPGDYTSYSGMRASGHFELSIKDRVIDRKTDLFQGMPPDNQPAVLEGFEDLPDDDLNMFSCWIEDEFPEN